MPSVRIIDDTPVRVLWLEALLSGMGWKLLPGDASADDRVRADLTLIALLLANSNGFELGVRLRAAGNESICLMTEQPRDTDRRWAQALGLQGVLQVPAPPQDLCLALRNSIRG